MGTNIFGDPSTFDIRQNQMIPYTEPALLPTRKTTFDAAVAELTVEHPPIEVGALQVVGCATYRFDGTQWVPAR
jgi:hypothetical protein